MDFDFCFSLGGSCAAAMQLQRRNLRLASFPFDWVVHVAPSSLDAIENFVAGDFKGLLARENLEPAPDDMVLTGKTLTEPQILDRAAGLLYAHDFRYSIFGAGGEKYYRSVLETQQRRAQRLGQWLASSESALAVMVPKFYEKSFVPFERLVQMRRAIEKRHPNLKLTIFSVQFESPELVAIDDPGERIHMRLLARPIHAYDCFQTDVVWSFLDAVRLTGRFGKDVAVEKKTMAGRGPLLARLHKNLYKYHRKWLVRHGVISAGKEGS